jgi:nucleoside phosphorylase
MNARTPSTIGILVSLKREIEPFLSRMGSTRRRRSSGCTLWEGSYGDTAVRVILTGVGRAVDLPSLEGCGALISTGFCGGLKVDLRVGDLFLADGVAYAGTELLARIMEPRRGAVRFDGSGLFDLGNTMIEPNHLKKTLDQCGLRLHRGRSVTCARVIGNEQKKGLLERHFDAQVVEMEDYGRVDVARRAGVDILCVRAVLDERGDPVPSFRGGLNPRGALSILRNVPRAQRSITVMLDGLIPMIVGKIDMG